MAVKFEMTKDEYDAIRAHTYNVYRALEETEEDFQILYNTLEKILKRNEKTKKI